MSGDTNAANTAYISGLYKLWVAIGNCLVMSKGITVIVNSLNLGVSQSGISLWSNHPGATYKWINCKDNSPIQGKTAQGHTNVTGGTFAVIVTQNGCSDTSDCVTVFGVGVTDIEGPGLL